MNFLNNMGMLSKLNNLRTEMSKISVEGQSANGKVTCKIGKTPQMTSRLNDLKIDPQLIKEEPHNIEGYVLEAVNEALVKETEQMAKLSPEVMSMLGQQQ
eukprot:TRINITY_DN1816_c0_g1_i1.p1 TRINITY_DN1816_c0_g1~~TRINITY_DN1816_c0_g1_i1.p1  ORF type:complete len:100 (+),score=28.24 TRINITY_DN1816_c0_g1_i1:58-357(+)